MVIDPRKEAEKQYMSLSDRLSQLDQTTSQVDPVVAQKMLDFSNVPVGYNPMNDIRGFLEYNEKSRGIRSGVADQQSALLSLLSQLSEADKDRSLQERKFALDEASTGMQYDPKTGKYKPLRGILTGEAAVAQVLKEGGADILNQAKDKDARKALAQEIVSMGGVKAYKKQLPLDALLNDNEKKSLAEGTDLLGKIDQAITLFAGGDKMGGTGPLAQMIPGFFASENTREMRRYTDDLRAQYQKLISGATVSDTEAKRLEKFLPTSGKTESQNLGDLQKLKRDLLLNMQLLEKAKQEGLTVNQAYQKYAKEVGLGGDVSNTGKKDKKSDPLGIL